MKLEQTSRPAGRWARPVLAAAALALLCAPAAARRKQWELPIARYQRMNAFERAQYNKAAKMFKEGSYKGAAAEFEKFGAQFQDSEQISYMLLMRGRSLQMAKTRNKAIKIYDELLDYFEDVIDDAAAAMYYKGLAHIENGDVNRGMVVLKQMVEDEDYAKEPFAAGALRKLADHYWAHDKQEQAVRYWKQAVRDFAKSNRDEANAARNNVTDYYIKKADYTGYERWLVSEENQDKAYHRFWVAQLAWSRAWNNFHRSWGKYTGKDAAKDKAKDMAAFYEYFQSRRTWYEKANRIWDYYHNAIYFVSHRMGDKKQTEKLVDEMAKWIKTLKDEADRDNKFSWVVDRMREVRNFLRARFCIAQIRNRYLATYKEYEVLGHGERKWKAAVSKLIELEGMGDASWQSTAEWRRAEAYHHYMRQYDKAIKLYQQISKPPKTLWAVQDCYWRWRKVKQAIGVCVEIESSFPKDASSAAWQIAYYYDRSGSKKMAIAKSRAILKKYPKSSASSRAHQLLEKYGKETGGGVIDED